MSLHSRYLQHTLCHILGCKCDGGCVLKSFKVEGRDEIVVEPYDHRFDIDRVIRTLKRRRKAILKSLNSNRVTITIFDDMRMYGAYVIDNDGAHRVA